MQWSVLSLENLADNRLQHFPLFCFQFQSHVCLSEVVKLTNSILTDHRLLWGTWSARGEITSVFLQPPVGASTSVFLWEFLKEISMFQSSHCCWWFYSACWLLLCIQNVFNTQARAVFTFKGTTGWCYILWFRDLCMCVIFMTENCWFLWKMWV